MADPFTAEEMDRLNTLSQPNTGGAAAKLLNPTSSPDEAAKTLSNSVATGVPFSVGNANPKEFNSDVETRKAISESNNSPELASYLNNTDFGAHVSRDDTAALGAIGPLLQPFARFEKGLVNTLIEGAKGLYQGAQESAPAVPYFNVDFDKKYPIFTAMWEPWFQAVGMALDAPNTLLGGVAGASEAIAGQLGMSQGDARRLGRDIKDLAMSGMTVAGGGDSVALMRAQERMAPVLDAANTLKKDISVDIKPYVESKEPPLPGVSASTDSLLIDAAKEDNKAYQDLLKETRKSKTLERSPEAFKALVEGAVQDKEISIPAAAIVEALGDKASEEFAWHPDFDERLRAALSTGGDVRIPLSDWLSHGNELADIFKEDVRLRPEGLTLREADALKETEPESYKQLPIGPDPEGMLGAHRPYVSEFKSAGAAATNESWLNPLFRDYGLEPHPTEGAKPLFTGPKDLGMPKPMWEKYQQRIQELRDAQDETAIKYAKKEIVKRQTEEWKAEESRRRSEIENDLKYRPDIMADRFFRNGKLVDQNVPAFKLDRELIEKRYGKGAADELNRSVTTKTGGVDPNDAAPLFGFGSGDAMVNQLRLLENKRRVNEQSPAQHFKETVDTALQASMEQYTKAKGDLETNIIKEAREAVGSGGQADLLADEMFALQKNWDE